MLDRFPRPDPAHADLEEIKKTTAKAGALTRQLLAFSRKQVLQPKVLDLNEVIANMVQMLRRLIGEHIELVATLAPELGRVKADPLQVEQVIMNLAINGADAMPQGGRLILETADVELGMELSPAELRPGPYVLLAVSDNGVGMDPETQGRLFEPFFTTKPPGKGTGLGLSTVYGIVAQSGGHLQVYSRPGYGSSFKVYLPRVPDPASPPSAPGPAEELRGSETVLVVEDEAAVRDLIRRVLASRGYTVLEADRAASALALVDGRGDPIPLIISDVVMPGGMGGRELAGVLAGRHPESRFLFISGYTPSAVLQGGLLEEGVHFLQKPFNPEALARKVREVLDGNG
ncbi:MAG: ATP-binding protein [Dehalococcoidia bacterium]|nr:ATP-binding protein [Dehalococcoidia bacterium]